MQKSFVVAAPLHAAPFAETIEHSLNSRIDANGRLSIVTGPEIGFLATLDRISRLSLSTSFMPFLIRNEQKWISGQERYPNGLSRADRQWVDIRVAAPNAFQSATQELAALLTDIEVAAKTFDPASPVAAQLLLAPHLRLLLDLLFRHPVRDCNCHEIALPSDNSGLIRAEIYNDFALQMRPVLLGRKSLRRELHNWDYGSEENVVHLRDYLNDLFERHDSLTILNLRLFHAGKRSDLVWTPVEDQHHELKALREFRARLFDRMRRKPALFTAKPGYVWAIMPSLEGGYDLHLTLLFDTAALRAVLDDKRVEAEQAGAILLDHADQVGQYWVTGATGGRGGYLRGDRSEWLYGPDWVHGEVLAGDFVRREKLTKTLGYLAMRRALVRLNSEPAGEYFGMRERKTRARPRSARRVGESG
ncbi:hypothetical protein ACW9YQ_16785 (plasmid) [Paraburkholderia strydomiana]